eukprot:gene24809-29980_t
MLELWLPGALLLMELTGFYGKVMNSAWPIYGQNPRQTRQSPYEGPADGDFYWSILTDGQLSGEPVVGTDGSIYFGTSTGTVYSLSAFGELQWNYSLKTGPNDQVNHEIMNSPALSANNRLFVSAFDDYVYCFSLSGELIWKTYQGGSMIASPLLSDDNSILYQGTSTWVNAIYTDTGENYWTFQTSSSYTPALGPEGNLYISSGANLYAVNSAGNQLWKCQVTTTGNIATSPVVSKDGSSVYVSDGGYVSSVVNGFVTWFSQVPSGTHGNLALGSDGNLYFATMGSSIYCFSPSGDVLWQYEAQGNVGYFQGVTLDVNNNIYAGTSNGAIFAVDSATQTTRWEYSIGSNIVTSPTITQSNMIIAPAINHYIYAFKPKNCSAGDYVTPDSSDFCTACSIGHYSDHDNAADCPACSYPWCAVFTGQSSCNGVLIVPPSSIITAAMILTTLALVVLACMSSSKQSVAIFVNLVFPTLDVFSDLAYLLTNEFYNLTLFILCLVFVLLPSYSFVKTLFERRARPCLYVKLSNIWWLEAGREEDHICFPKFPLFKSSGGRLPFLSSTEHSSFPSVVAELVAWIIAIVSQILTVVFFLPANVLFLGFWFLVGVFLHLTKMLTVGKVWNAWFSIWTQSGIHDTDVDVDTAELIQSLEEEFVAETIPQFAVQLANNVMLKRFTPIAAFSMTFSIVMSVNSVWRHLYFRFVRLDAMALEDIPIGMVLSIGDTVLLDATLQAAKKKAIKPQYADANKANEPLLSDPSHPSEPIEKVADRRDLIETGANEVASL